MGCGLVRLVTLLAVVARISGRARIGCIIMAAT